jgi:hypothetical protein
MKHPLSAVSRLHNQQKLQSELEFQIEEGKQFNLNQHQLLLKKMILIKVKTVVIIRN